MPKKHYFLEKQLYKMEFKNIQEHHYLSYSKMQLFTDINLDKYLMTKHLNLLFF